MANIFNLLGDVEIFIASYVVLFILINFLNMFAKAINPKFGRLLEKEEKIIEGTLCKEGK